MPLYRYKALTQEGKSVDGLIEADSLVMVKERLKTRKVLVTQIEEAEKKRRAFALSKDTLLIVTRELGQLLKAGLPLYESFVTIEEKSRRDKHHGLFVEIIDRLKQGENLSGIFKSYPAIFDPVYVAMVAAAEKSGALASAFAQIALYLDKQAKWKKQIVTITTYPLFLLSFSLFIFCALLFFLIPSMQELYEGRDLHPLTNAVLALSVFCRAHTLSLIITVFVSIFGGFWAVTNRVIYTKVMSSLLDWPFIGDVIVQTKMARFARVVNLLLLNGISLIDALKLARPMLKSSLFEEALAHTEKKMIEGRSLYHELKETGRFPSLVVRLIAIAEETGKMKEAFGSIADIYDEKLSASLEKLTTILQPALLFLLGLIVGLIILAVLLPLTDVSSFLS